MRDKNLNKGRLLKIVEEQRKLTEGAPWASQERPALVVKSYLDFLRHQNLNPEQVVRH